MPPPPNRYDTLAANLLFASFLLGIITTFFTDSDLSTSTLFDRPAAWLFASISVVVVLADYYYIRQGYDWAKVLFFIFFGFSLLTLLVGFKQVAATQFASPLKGISFAVQWLSRITAVSLLIISFRSKDRPTS
jgi:hypothetical protein